MNGYEDFTDAEIKVEYVWALQHGEPNAVEILVEINRRIQLAQAIAE